MVRLRILLTLLVLVALLNSVSVLYAQKRNSKIGSNAPALTIEKFYDSEGATSDIKKLKGKVVVIDFWGSWCGPCIKSFPHMNDLVKTFKNKDVVFMSLGYEDSDKAKRLWDKHQVKAWKAIDTDLSVFTDYEAWSIPLIIIIDKKGTIIAEMHPEHLKKETIELALKGQKIQNPEDVKLPYYEPAGAKEYFLSVVKEK